MRHYKTLTFTDRLRIEKMLKEGKSKTEIANALHVHYSTIYRELKRGTYEHLNSDYTTGTRYSPDKSEARYRENMAAKGPGLKIGSDIKLAEFLEKTIIEKKYSPAAALAEVKRQGLQFSTTICLATLYNYISKGVFLRLTNKDLPRRGRKKRTHRKVRAARPPRGKSIEERPQEINERTGFGHWEMDTVVSGRGGKATLLVLTERKSRHELIAKMPDKTNGSVLKAIDRLEKKYGKLFQKVFKSITMDNGSEFSDCVGIECSVHGDERTTTYYCHPYSAYERGSNENQNAMIRRWFAKGTIFDTISEDEIAQVEKWLNEYPRPQFNYACSSDYFNSFLCNLTK